MLNPPIVIRGNVTQLGDDDCGKPSVWIAADDQAIKVQLSRAQCAQLAPFLFGGDVELVIQPAGTAPGPR